MSGKGESGGALMVEGVRIERPPIAPAIAQLALFRRELERVFLILAEELPGLASKGQQQAAGLERFLGQEAEAYTCEILLATESTVALIEGEIGRITGLSQRTAVSLDAVRAAVRAIQAAARDMASLSFRLGLTAVNAAAIAARANAEGRAFAALSRELGELTHSSATQAQRAEESARSIAGETELLVELIGQIESSLGGMAERGTASLCSTRDETQNQLRLMSSGLAAAAERGRGVFSGIQQTMVAIQREDLLRQGMDHVSMSLEQLGEAFDALQPDAAGAEVSPKDVAGFLSFQQQVGELGNSMLLQLERELSTLLSDLGRSLGLLSETVTAIQTDAPRALRACTDLSPMAGRLSTLVAQLGEPAAELPRCRQVAGRLKALAEALGDALGRLAELMRSIRMVRVLMEMETARHGNLAAAAFLAQDIAKCQTGLAAAAGRAEVSSRELGKLVHHISELTGDLGAYGRRADAIGEQVDRQACSMERAATRFSEQLQSLVQASRSIHLQVGILQEHAKRLGASTKESEAVSVLCAQLAAEADRLRHCLAARGVAATQVDAQASMEALMSRFTRVSHKELAGQLVDVQVEKGDEGGELTLF